ncbi:MAG: aminomethyltransferase family protein, partial [Methylocella sp.]
VHDALNQNNSWWGVSWGVEVPLYFAPSKDFVETPTLKRSNAHGIVGEECRKTREGVGLIDITAFSRYEVSGPRAHQWLNRVMACRIPDQGRVALAPMLSPSGKLQGDLTVLNWGDGTFWVMGSYYLRQWHMRWFESHMEEGVNLRDMSDAWVGLALAGPKSREVLERVVANADVSPEAFSFLSCRKLDVGLSRARVARLSVIGELGYEINVPAAEQLSLYRTLKKAGEELGMHEFGFNAMLSMRLEKSFGIWSREFTQAYTPGMTGMDRFISFKKGDFIGRDAALREKETGPKQRLVTLDIAADSADASGYEPVWQDGRRIGFVTSGGYGHYIGKSLAMALVEPSCAAAGTSLSVHVVGVERQAKVIAPSPYDPTGQRMRA